MGAEGDQENCVRSQGAHCEQAWGIVVPCTIFLVPCIFFNKCLYFSYAWLNTFCAGLTYLENTYEILILVEDEKVTDDAMPEGMNIHSNYLYSYLVFALSTQLWIACVHNHLRTRCAQEYLFYSMKFTHYTIGMGSVSIKALQQARR